MDTSNNIRPCQVSGLEEVVSPRTRVGKRGCFPSMIRADFAEKELKGSTLMLRELWAEGRNRQQAHPAEI